MLAAKSAPSSQFRRALFIYFDGGLTTECRLDGQCKTATLTSKQVRKHTANSLYVGLSEMLSWQCVMRDMYDNIPYGLQDILYGYMDYTCSINIFNYGIHFPIIVASHKPKTAAYPLWG